MIRILCVEDDPAVQGYLSQRLALEQDVTIVGIVSDITRALIHLSRGEIDVVLLDYCLCGLDGTHLLQSMAPWGQRLSHNPVHPPVLFCTAFADPGFQARARMLGARGVVAKDRMSVDLIPALRAVARGGCWFDGEAKELIHEHPSATASAHH